MSMSPDDDLLGIPEFLKRKPKVKDESVMKNFATDDAVAADEAATDEASAPPKSAPAKRKANGHDKGASAKAPKKTAKKAAPKKAAKKAAPKKTGSHKKGRTRDPQKLDEFGFRKGSVKSQAAALYKKGATLKDVKEALGSIQFNLLTELEAKGFTIEKKEIGKEGERKSTRYTLKAKR